MGSIETLCRDPKKVTCVFPPQEALAAPMPPCTVVKQCLDLRVLPPPITCRTSTAMHEKLLLSTKSLFTKKKIFGFMKSVLTRIYNKIPKKYVYAIVIIVGVVLTYNVAKVGIQLAWALTSGQVEFLVEGRDRVVRDAGSSYELYTSIGVLTNQDSMLHLKRNSGDLQNELRPGRTYICDTQGFRFLYLDLMQNVISCVEKTLSDGGVSK